MIDSMTTSKTSSSLRHVIVPIIYGYEDETALTLAMSLGIPITLIGIVAVDDENSLSIGSKNARLLRKQIQAIPNIKSDRSPLIIVSHQPWQDLLIFLKKHQTDVFLTDFLSLDYLKTSPQRVLSQPCCNIALVRGPIRKNNNQINRVLVPLRGGPYAELALRLGLRIAPSSLNTLRIRLKDSPDSEPSFRGLAQILDDLPEVSKKEMVTEDTATALLNISNQYDLVIMGVSAQQTSSTNSLGAVTDRLLKESKAAILAVRTYQEMGNPADELVGARAISVLVDKWFAENTYHAHEFNDLYKLTQLKERQKLKISLVLPALNEEKTLENIIVNAQKSLMKNVPLIDEMVLMDSNSTDRTREIARDLGLPVYIHQDLLPELGARRGKGEALWKSLLVTQGDIITWLDTDIENFQPHLIYGILGPLLVDPKLQLVKGFFLRSLKLGEKMQLGGGGRVTELVARPMINLFYPELSGVIQPLSGQFAGKRSAFEQCSFSSGYGVEMELLLEIFTKFGLNSIAQVDLIELIHNNQQLEALSKMSFVIIQTLMHKLEKRYERSFIADVNKTMKLIRHDIDGYYLDVEEIVERYRPPMMDIPQYRELRRLKSI